MSIADTPADLELTDEQSDRHEREANRFARLLGLQAMATELKRLQQAKSLRRVIRVSHQPDFTEQFSVGYTLEAGESGTTATAFRGRK